MATITATLGCGGPPAAKREATAPAFEEMAAEAGLEFDHFIGATGELYLPEIMGSGVAVFDYDSDGDLDIYLLQGALLDPEADLGDSVFPWPAGERPVNKLFRNEIIPSGELRFRDVTAEAGVGHPGYGMGAAVGDYDGDSDLDLFVTNVGPNVLYRNNNDGTFSESTPTGMDDPRWSASAAFVDYDRDGDLDLAFVNYVDFSVRNNKECFAPTGARDYCSPNVYEPVPDRLFRNDGDGRWSDVSVSAGLGEAYGNGLGVLCADFDNDGWADIYVANDGTANQLWTNQRNGTFANTALLAGAAYNSDGMPEAGMGIAAADFDFDGDEDLFVTHLAQETSTLYFNDGDGGFRDRTTRFGLGPLSKQFTGFGVIWFDYDLDSGLDLFVANGAVTALPDRPSSSYPFAQRNQLYRWTGERFVDAVDAAGPALALGEVSRGLAAGDLDLDGDADLVISNNNGPVRLLLNRAGDGKPVLRLQSRVPHTRAAVIHPDGSLRWTRIHSDGSYLSASELAASVAVDSGAPRSVGVVWPDGSRELFTEVAPGKPVNLEPGGGEPWSLERQEPKE